MAAIGISFFYEEEKVQILRDAAEADDRTTSSYIQLLFTEHIKEIESGKPVLKKQIAPPAAKKKRVIKKRRFKRNG